jgi:2-iminoacetate synthase
MSFVEAFRALPLEGLMSQARSSNTEYVDATLRRGPSSLADFATLLSPAASTRLEELCRRSQSLTRQRFGKTIRLFAPLYLSNECINNCAYCGFSRDNPILRVTLSVEEVERKGVGPHY